MPFPGPPHYGREVKDTKRIGPVTASAETRWKGFVAERLFCQGLADILTHDKGGTTDVMGKAYILPNSLPGKGSLFVAERLFCQGLADLLTHDKVGTTDVMGKAAILPNSLPGKGSFFKTCNPSAVVD